MKRYRIEFECEECDVDAVVADGRWELKEVEPEVVGSKYVTSLHVEDPDTEQLVEMEIRKLDTGAMVGFDGSYLEQLGDGEHPFSPYDEDTIIVVPDDEGMVIEVTGSPHVEDDNFPWRYEPDSFINWYWEVFQEGRDDAERLSVDEVIYVLTDLGYTVQRVPARLKDIRELMCKWIPEILSSLGGRATVVKIAKAIYEEHQEEIESSGDALYTWQYDMRWARQALSDNGILVPTDHPKWQKGVWELLK